MATKTCQHCGKEFETWNPRKRYCSFTCADAHAKPKRAAYLKAYAERQKKQAPRKKCLVCGSPFGGANKFYCSKECANRARKNLRKRKAPNAPLEPKRTVKTKEPKGAIEREYVALCKEFGRAVHYCVQCGRPTPDRMCRECRGEYYGSSYAGDEYGYEVAL